MITREPLENLQDAREMLLEQRNDNNGEDVALPERITRNDFTTRLLRWGYVQKGFIFKLGKHKWFLSDTYAVLRDFKSIPGIDRAYLKLAEGCNVRHNSIDNNWVAPWEKPFTYGT